MVFDHDNDRTLVDGEVAVGDPVFFGAEGVAEAVGSPNWIFIWLSINVSVGTAAAIVQGGCTGCVTRGEERSHRTHIKEIAQGGEALFR